MAWSSHTAWSHRLRAPHQLCSTPKPPGELPANNGLAREGDGGGGCGATGREGGVAGGQALGRQGGSASLISEILGLGLFFWLRELGVLLEARQATTQEARRVSRDPRAEGWGEPARVRTGRPGAAGVAHPGGRQAPAPLLEPQVDCRTQLSFGAADPKPGGIKAFFRCCQMMSEKATVCQPLVQTASGMRRIGSLFTLSVTYF